jgi:two-component system, LytTR family, response regulator
MIRCIIIDDELLARALLKEYLQAIPNIEIVAECADGFEGVKAISTHKPELILLDVQMPKLNGFEMLELLEHTPAVIFTTAFDEYALKAFDANAIDYLLKPFSPERLQTAILKAINNGPKVEKIMQADTPILAEVQNPRIVVKDNHQIHIVPYSEILYIESADDYVKIYTATRYYLKKKTMAYFEANLPTTEFCRVHRGYIVALKEIAKVEPWEKDGAVITLKNKQEIDVSKAGYKVLKGILGI